MGKDKQTPIVVDGKEYIYEDMKPEEQTIVNHIVDLDRKINSSRFNLDQLQFGRDSFMGLLNQKLSEISDVEVKSVS